MIATETTIKEIIRDTTIIIPPDSAWLYAWLECDSNQQVILNSVDINRGDRIIPKLEMTQPGVIKFSCKEVDSLRLLLQLKDKEFRENTKEKEYIEVPAPLNWFQKTIQICGYLFLVLIILVIIKQLIK